MTTRQRIAHLLRRFGLGATPAEVDRLEPFGVDGALNWLLNYEKVEESVPVIPWEFCHEDNSKEIYVDPFRFVAYWGASLLLTQRPLEHRLAVFWHDHFAVSGAKVELGTMLLDYLTTLRALGGGKFGDLLQAVAAEPAMIRYLDLDASFRGRPNENFAREAMELFTTGPGPYTEKDIQEAARAFTGYGIRYLVFEAGGERVQERIRESILNGQPLAAFAFSPSLHDDSEKTVLGRTDRFDGPKLLDMLARHPETARTITAKLWRFFASETLPSEVHAALIKRWNETDGNIREVLRAIAAQPAFWDERSVRKLVKSPLDFVVPIVRQLAVRDYVAASRTGAPMDPMKRAPKPFMDTSGLIFGMMAKQGMTLFFPPNVGGWEWGEKWISAANMAERTNLGNLIMGVGQADQGLAAYQGLLLLGSNPPTDEACIDRFLAQFDAELPAEKKALVVQAFSAAGGREGLKTAAGASKALGAAARLVFGAPEFQMF